MLSRDPASSTGSRHHHVEVFSRHRQHTASHLFCLRAGFGFIGFGFIGFGCTRTEQDNLFFGNGWCVPVGCSTGPPAEDSDSAGEAGVPPAPAVKDACSGGDDLVQEQEAGGIVGRRKAPDLGSRPRVEIMESKRGGIVLYARVSCLAAETRKGRGRKLGVYA